MAIVAMIAASAVFAAIVAIDRLRPVPPDHIYCMRVGKPSARPPSSPTERTRVRTG